MSIYLKNYVISKSKWLQMKPKLSKLVCNLLKKTWDQSRMNRGDR